MSSSQSGRICPTCHNRGRVENWRADASFFDIDTSWEELRKSTPTCLLCDAIWQAFQNIVPNSDPLWTHTKIILRISVSGPTFEVIALESVSKAHLRSLRPFRLWHSAGTSPESSSVLEELSAISVPPQLIPSEPLSFRALSMVKRWICDCADHNHRWAVQSTYLPDRLGDVGPADGAVEPVLIDTTRGITGPYLALSHCWGGTIPYRTLRRNKDKLCKRIDVSQLSQNFKDAVEVTRWLDFRYIWIDSFCIVQDDRKDWLDQSTKMASIYSGAFLTISATRSASFNEGFLAERHPDTILCLSRILPRGVEVYVRDDEKLHQCHVDVDGGRTYTREPSPPLFDRGWALQERLISPRLLHFMEHELIYECEAGLRCECAVDHTPDGSMKHRTANDSRDNVWEMLVEKYTRMRLTYPRDILPAFSAIARSLTVSRYLAGLRVDYLLHDLLWSAAETKDIYTGERRTAFRPGTYTTPTFSWASVVGLIQSLGNSIRLVPRFQLEDSFIALENPNDLFGRVTDGWLRLRGPVASAKMLSGPNIEDKQFRGTIACGLHPMFAAFDTPRDPPHGVPLICMIIGVSPCIPPQPPFAEYDVGRRVYGLILTPSRTRTGTYERVGCFHEAYEADLQELKEASITVT